MTAGGVPNRRHAVGPPPTSPRLALIPAGGAAPASRLRRRRPLAGVTVLCLGRSATVTRLAARVWQLGGAALPAPAFHILAGDLSGLRDALTRAARGTFTGLCFTSAPGVESLAREMRTLSLDPSRLFADLMVGSVGAGTSRAIEEQLGRRPDIQPAAGTGAALGQAVPIGYGPILLPLSDLAPGTLETALHARGYTPVRVTAYRNRRAMTLPAAADAAVRGGTVDLTVLTSPSSARALVRLIDAERRSPVLSIGPSTSAACASLGVEVVAEAAPHDLDGVQQALIDAVPGRVITHPSTGDLSDGRDHADGTRRPGRLPIDRGARGMHPPQKPTQPDRRVRDDPGWEDPRCIW